MTYYAETYREAVASAMIHFKDGLPASSVDAVPQERILRIKIAISMVERHGETTVEYFTQLMLISVS